MNIFEFEAYARATIPVPTGHLIVTHKLHTRPDSLPSVTWDVSHFSPSVFDKCTIGYGETPEAALADLILQITCTPSAPSESSATPSPSASGMESPPSPPNSSSDTTATAAD